MNTNELRQFDMFQKVAEFTTQHAADFPAESVAVESLATLRRVIDNLKKFDANQNSHASTGRRHTTLKSATRESLIEDLKAISRCARALSRRIPALDQKFKLSVKPNNFTILSVARTFAEDAEPYVGEFTRYGLPADFLQDLRADIAAFERAGLDQTTTSLAVTTAADAIDQEIADGLDAVRDLDALTRVVYRSDANMLGQWTRVSHVERPPRPAKAAKTAVATTTA